MSKHKEPWAYFPHDRTIRVLVPGSPGGPQLSERIASCHDRATGERIVACVNFCQGVPDEFLVGRTAVEGFQQERGYMPWEKP